MLFCWSVLFAQSKWKSPLKCFPRFDKHIGFLFGVHFGIPTRIGEQDWDSCYLCVSGVNRSKMLRMLLSWHQPRGVGYSLSESPHRITLPFLLHRDPLLNRWSLCVARRVCICLFLVSQKLLCSVQGVVHRVVHILLLPLVPSGSHQNIVSRHQLLRNTHKELSQPQNHK